MPPVASRNTASKKVAEPKKLAAVKKVAEPKKVAAVKKVAEPTKAAAVKKVAEPKKAPVKKAPAKNVAAVKKATTKKPTTKKVAPVRITPAGDPLVEVIEFTPDPSALDRWGTITAYNSSTGEVDIELDMIDGAEAPEHIRADLRKVRLDAADDEPLYEQRRVYVRHDAEQRSVRSVYAS